jgi:hypothetical protein
MKDLGTWGERSAQDDQILALTTRIEELSKSVPNKPNDINKSSDNKNKDSKVPKWKYDETLSSGDSLQRNDKTYKCCTGPGHGSVGIWVIQ